MPAVEKDPSQLQVPRVLPEQCILAQAHAQLITANNKTGDALWRREVNPLLGEDRHFLLQLGIYVPCRFAVKKKIVASTESGLGQSRKTIRNNSVT